MSIKNRAASAVKAVLSATVAAWLPRDCLLCGAASNGAASHHAALCADCHDHLPRLTTQHCPQCALPTPGAAVCGACMKHAPSFDATTALWHYDFPIDRMIQSIKYSHRLASADFFGAELAMLPRTATVADFILPVPLSAQRLKQRGFNQSVEIARPLARQLGIPLELKHIRRQRDTTPQATLPWKERAKNIRHAFECHIDLTGKTVLVVDDVMTTGATLNELARTLKAYGAVRVENYVLARAVKHG